MSADRNRFTAFHGYAQRLQLISEICALLLIQLECQIFVVHVHHLAALRAWNEFKSLMHCIRHKFVRAWRLSMYLTVEMALAYDLIRFRLHATPAANRHLSDFHHCRRLAQRFMTMMARQKCSVGRNRWRDSLFGKKQFASSWISVEKEYNLNGFVLTLAWG